MRYCCILELALAPMISMVYFPRFSSRREGGRNTLPTRVCMASGSSTLLQRDTRTEHLHFYHLIIFPSSCHIVASVQYRQKGRPANLRLWLIWLEGETATHSRLVKDLASSLSAIHLAATSTLLEVALRPSQHKFGRFTTQLRESFMFHEGIVATSFSTTRTVTTSQGGLIPGPKVRPQPSSLQARPPPSPSHPFICILLHT